MSFMKVGAAIGVLLGATVALGDHDSDIRQIDSVYRTLEKGIKAKSLKTIMSTGTFDMVWISPDGKTVSGKELRQMMEGQMRDPNLKFHSVQMKTDSYGFMGNECRVRCTAILVFSAKADGQWMKMKGIHEGVDTFRKTPKGWRFAKVEVLSESMEPVN